MQKTVSAFWDIYFDVAHAISNLEHLCIKYPPPPPVMGSICTNRRQKKRTDVSISFQMQVHTIKSTVTYINKIDAEQKKQIRNGLFLSWGDGNVSGGRTEAE
jgi:hypothetical protein